MEALFMDYVKIDSPNKDEPAEVREPSVAYAAVGSVAGAGFGDDEWLDNDPHASDDCPCPVCRSKRVSYESAARANGLLDAGYEKYADLLIAARQRGYNEETIDAIKETLDAKEGKIKLKRYATIEEMIADIDADIT
jgi:hypothetical protein